MNVGRQFLINQLISSIHEHMKQKFFSNLFHAVVINIVNYYTTERLI